MPGAKFELSEQNLRRIWAALVSEVMGHFGLTRCKEIFLSAGLMAEASKTGYREPLIAAINEEFSAFSPEDKLRSIHVLAKRLTESGTAITGSLTALLRDHGFQFINGAFVPIGFFDEREAAFLPESSASDVAKAVSRLLTGDLDGALTAACGAVDTAATQIYQTSSLGDPREDSFQKKAIKAIAAVGKIEQLEHDLVSIGWNQNDAHILCENLKGSLNQAAYVLQSLRSRMSDAHGGKPTLEAVVFDSLKIASVLLSLMK